MSEYTSGVLPMLTEFFSTREIETTARRTGFVKRTSKITGKIFLALVTFGVWSDAKTTLGQLATKATQLGEPLEVSPEAIHQRMNGRAVAFLQELIRQALGKVQGLKRLCEDGVFAAFTKVYLADSTGFGLPPSLQDLFPGAGGSAAKAGAKIQAVWDYKSSMFGHFALTPWNLPDSKYIDTVIALAHQGVLFIFDLGYFKLKALARIAASGAYFLSRLNHKTYLFEAAAHHMQRLELPRVLGSMQGTTIEKQVLLGAHDLLPSRLIAVRMPEAIVNKRRRIAKKNAKKKGYTASTEHLQLLAWNLFITNVPGMIWKAETVVRAYPIRWQIELIFKSWKSSCHLAAINTKKVDTTLCYLYGRMLLILINYALCPQIRHNLWLKKHRELSLLKLVRHFQALADSWMKVIFQSELELQRFLKRACATAERLTAKASRVRRTTAQTLRECVEQQHELVEFAVAINA